MKQLVTWIVGISLLIGAAHARAASLGMPLEGYYRPGKYMPVRIEENTDTIRISGHGAVPTLLPSRPKAVIAPVLMVGHLISSLQARADRPNSPVIPSRPLHRLKPDQRLIATVLGDDPAHPLWFADAKRIVLPLDAQTLLNSPPTAWNLLDGLILDRATYQRLGQDRVILLLSGGTSLAVQSRHRPDGNWPWRVDDAGFWHPQITTASLPAAQVNESAYRPTFSWAGDWAASLRWRVAAMAIGWVLVILLIGWLPHRWRLPAMGAATILTVAGLWTWRRNAMPYLQLNGVILRQSDSLCVRDHWFYQTTPEAGSAAFAFADVTLPIFASLDQIDHYQIRLLCDVSGQPVGFAYHLPTRGRMAFVCRRVEPNPASHRQTPANPTPLRDLAQALYAGPNCSIVGQIAGEKNASWPTVVLQCSIKSTRHDAQNQHPE